MISKYQLGDTWSSNFDYDGMLQKGMIANVSWPLQDLEKLYSSFESVNYHREAGYLWTAIQDLKADSKDQPFQAEEGLEDFNNECEKTLQSYH